LYNKKIIGKVLEAQKQKNKELSKGEEQVGGFSQDKLDTAQLNAGDSNQEAADVEFRPLKIALLGYRSNPYSGGQGIYIKYLSKALVDLGHEVDVISGEPYPHVDERVKLIKLPGLNLFENGLLSLRPRHLLSYADSVEWVSKLTGGFSEPYCFGVRVNEYLKKHGCQYDIIHDNQSLSYGMLAIQKRQPLVTTFHHPITSDLSLALSQATNLWQKVLIRRWHSFLIMQKRVMKKLDHVVSVSKQSITDISEGFDVPESQLDLIYNGIDVEEFCPREGIERRPNRLMATASADQPLKGLRFLLEAYASLLDEFPDLELLVVGKPKAGGDTEKCLKKLNIQERVTFVSGISTEKMVDLYAEAAIAVVPSLYEGFGLPAGEAMASGVPVVSTNGGALPEVVGDAGVMVEKADSQALACAIAELLNNPEKANKLAVKGRARIHEKFSWQVAANEFTRYYLKAIAKNQSALMKASTNR
jgi:glycosyltransferase involved in cell wall biosynthesis